MLSRAVSGDERVPELPYFTLELRECPHSDGVEVILTGRLDSRTAGHLDDGLRWVVEHTRQGSVVVDLSGVDRLESSGVEVLVRVRGELAADRRTLDLRGRHGPVRTLLRVAGLLDTPPRPDLTGGP
jgi:anti-anti-sigma factor